MDIKTKHLFLKRLQMLMIILLFVNLIFFSNLTITIAISFLILFFILLDFYFLFTRKEKGTMIDKPNIEITNKIYMYAFFGSLIILMILGFLDLFEIVKMSTTNALVSALFISVIFHYCLDEYYNSKKGQ